MIFIIWNLFQVNYNDYINRWQLQLKVRDERLGQVSELQKFLQDLDHFPAMAFHWRRAKYLRKSFPTPRRRPNSCSPSTLPSRARSMRTMATTKRWKSSATIWSKGKRIRSTYSSERYTVDAISELTVQSIEPRRILATHSDFDP